MNPALRAAVAHLAVADVDAPELASDDRHHLLRVLRARRGELVTVTNGAGSWRPCRVAADGVEPDGDVYHEPAPTHRLTLAVVVPKADRPEWLVRKATEIGIDVILMLHSRRSVVRWQGAAKADAARRRLQAVAVDASLQSRRVWFPEVEGPVDASTMLAGAAIAEPGGSAIGSADTTVAIGPEGGWEDAELALGRTTVGLGDTILRVETAALVAAAEMVRLRSLAGPA
ncbi:MAG: RsmE family RNA methyltransferase [Ilumatobacteraceae bacterium]